MWVEIWRENTPGLQKGIQNMTTEKKVALVCGVSGQDGAFLARLLLKKGYEVWGSSRDAGGANFQNLKTLGIYDSVLKVSIYPAEFRSVLMAFAKIQPDEVYFLAGQTSVSLSFELPAETIESITLGTLNILEACKACKKSVKLFHAGSSECFGDTIGSPATETTAFHPLSPYAVAKGAAIWLVDNYREAYGLYACSGILFNHESELRKNRFVTQKIISTARQISEGKTDKLILGDLSISRDWGWAPEYVEAMWLMLQMPKATNFVIATGESNTLENFVACAFQEFGLDWTDYVEVSKDYYRPNDIQVSSANPSKAMKELGWSATMKMDDVIKAMIRS